MTETSPLIALVTGANKGIGFEIARQIAKSGVIVFASARSKELGEAAAAKLRAEGLDARYIRLDVRDRASISLTAETIARDFGRLDILVNNAGIIAPGDDWPSKASLESVEESLQTNFIGPLAVIQAMLPLLRKARAARIVNVSSNFASLTYNGDPNYTSLPVRRMGYAAAKVSLNMLTVQLAFELRDTAIKVNAVDPGFTATDINNYRGRQTIPEGAQEAVRLALLPDDGPSGGYTDRHGPAPW